MNKVILIGRLGKSPELKSVSGNTVTKFSIATSEKWTKDGSVQQKTEWHNVVVWGKLAEITAKYLNKGKQVMVEGKLVTRSWEDKNGNKKFTTEVVGNYVEFLDSVKETNNSAVNTSMPEQEFGPEPGFDDEEPLPF